MNEDISKKIERFFMQFKHQLYKKGEILIRADDDPPGIFYLKKGVVKEYAISKKGDEIVVNVFKPVVFFPMSWAMNSTPNTYFFEATENVEVWKAPRDKVVEFIKQEPDVLYDLLSRVYRGTDGLLMRMSYLMAGNAYARLITELLLYVKRFQKNAKNDVEIGISEIDLAARAGMTRETISREMKHLKDKHLITANNKGKLVISNVAQLEEELDSGV